MKGQRGSFLGFTFNDIHSSVFGITRTSDGNRYNNNVTPSRSDIVGEIPGAEGQAYFGSTFDKTDFTINYAFDGMTEEQMQNMKMIWNDKKIHDFIYDEYPHKVYSAKLTGQSQIKHVVFEEDGKRIYKGEGTLVFTCYFPYARSRYEYQEDYTIGTIPEWNKDEDFDELMMQYISMRTGSKYYNSWVYTGKLMPDFPGQLSTYNNSGYEIPNQEEGWIRYYNKDSDYVNFSEWIDESHIPSKNDDYGKFNNGVCNIYNAGDIPSPLRLWIEVPTKETEEVIIQLKDPTKEEEAILGKLIIYPYSLIDNQVKYLVIDSRSNSVQMYDIDKKRVRAMYKGQVIGKFFELPIGISELTVTGAKPLQLDLKYYYI